MKRKICVVLTARTSYTKIKPILKAVQDHESLDLKVICAASAVLERFGNTHKMVENDGFPIDDKIHMIIEGETLLTSAQSVGLGIIEFATSFNRLQPDIILVMADRYEILAPAIAAAYQNIPLAHVQGGEVSGNIDEKVRHTVTKLADYHFPATKRAADNIIRMGENPDYVFHVGCPSIDIAKDVNKSPDLGFDLYEKYGGVGSQPSLSDGYYIVMQHPVTTEYGQAKEQINQTLHAMAEVKKPVIWFWPNIDAGSDNISKGIRAYREHNDLGHMHFIKNMAPEDFLRLLNNSLGIIGNSSAAIREASFLGIPAVNIGSRQNARERGENVVDVSSYNKEDILKAVIGHCNKDNNKKIELYGSGNAGALIAKTLANVKLTYSKTLSFKERP
jgi:UDP-hydrolysing UDP-N-acetyl-D-glucosamine 2-epimerase